MLFNNNQLEILYILIAIIIIIFTIGYYYICNSNNIEFNNYDILSKNYNNTNIKILDNYLEGWGLSHLILYFILTYIYPSEWLFLLICGIIWEIIEYVISLYHKKINKFYICSNYNENNDYWYAQYEDIIMNILGIILALLIRKIIK